MSQPPPYTMTTVPPPPLAFGGSAYAASTDRPALITAIGVTSIVLASLSLVGAVIGGFQTYMLYHTAQVTATQARSVMSRASAVGDIAPAEAVAAEARKSAAKRRSGVVDLLVNAEPTAAPARRQLDAVLAHHGAAILPRKALAEDRFTAGELDELLKDHGVRSVGPDDPAPTVFYQFDTGRLEVDRKGAVFRPTSGPALRATAGDPPPAADAFDVRPADEDDPATRPAGPLAGGTYVPLPLTVVYPSGLTGSQINGVVNKVAAALPPPQALSAGHRLSLQQALQATDPVLVPPEAAYSPVRMAQVQPDGTMIVRFPGGAVVLDGEGTILDKFGESIERVTFHPLALTLLVGEAVASSALAILLLMAGIFVVRRSAVGGGLHWIYAVAKLAVVVAGAVAFHWVMSDLNRGVTSAVGRGIGQGWTSFWMTVMVLGGVYPVVLLFVLRAPSVRSYWRTAE